MNPEKSAILRMIDANLNRCREGIRVVEDCARFMLNDPQITGSCKQLRHQLRSAIDSLELGQLDLISSRDTQTDVGTSISTIAESDRTQGMRDLVSAACKRAAEALRVIEECTKALGHSGSACESIRYQLYTIEKNTILALRPPCPQWTLCVLITKSLCTHHDPIEIVKRAALGGADCIQIREKTMTDGDMAEHARTLTQCAHDHGMHVMINDRVHIASLVHADGIHLGQDDLPISAARSLLGPRAWIGRTCPTLKHAIDAIEQGTDTCGLGPVFASSTKSKPTIAGVELIESYLHNENTQHVPMLAISGIDPSNVGQLAKVGCRGVAVSSSVCGSPDPESVCRSIVETIGQTISAHNSQHPNCEPTINA